MTHLQCVLCTVIDATEPSGGCGVGGCGCGCGCVGGLLGAASGVVEDSVCVREDSESSAGGRCVLRDSNLGHQLATR